MAKTAELRELTDQDLVDRLEGARQELFNLRFQHATNRLDNTARLGQVRKEIAQVSTLIREREIAAAEGALSGSQKGASK